MKKLLSLFVVAGVLGLHVGCSDETKSSKKTESTKEVKKSDGSIEKTTENKEVKKEDGKVIEKKEEKKVEPK
jgi:hypothetical protein